MCQLTTFVKGISSWKLWWYNVCFIWKCKDLVKYSSSLLFFLSVLPSLVNVFSTLRLKSVLPWALMAKWVTGQWQETNVSLHHTGHPHKLSSTPGPRSEFLIRLWWGWWGLCFERGNQGCHQVYPPFTKSSVLCVYHFFHCSHTEWTVFGFQQHWSASELLGLGILQGKWSARPGEMAHHWEALIEFPWGRHCLRFTSRSLLIY